MDRLPDFCETTIKKIDYFTFLLPVTAWGFHDDMIMEICVEYGKSADSTQYCANVWAHQKGSLIKQFIYPLSVRVGREPETAIVEALNTDETFGNLMRDFICETAKNRCD